MNRLKKLKKIRLHREGTSILIVSAILLIGINALLFWGIECKIPFYIFAAASIVVYLLMVNFAVSIPQNNRALIPINRMALTIKMLVPSLCSLIFFNFFSRFMIV